VRILAILLIKAVQRLVHVPKHVICQHAKDYMRLYPVIFVMVNGANFQLNPNFSNLSNIMVKTVDMMRFL